MEAQVSELPPIDGALLKKLRKNRGWNQTQMAEFLGCSQGRVSRFELGADIGKPYRKLLLSLIMQPPQGKSQVSA
jgi:transcriptional regulator with XRE-family HTH domain